LRVVPVEDLAVAAGADTRPTLLIVPEHDEFRPPDAAREATSGWTATTIEVVAGADHFLVGHSAKVADLVTAFAASLA
jgi:alpha/beta superfamily hydrolase